MDFRRVFFVSMLLLLVSCKQQNATSQFPTPSSRSAIPLTLTDGEEDYPLTQYIEILNDPDEDLSFAQVSSPEFDSKFIPTTDYMFSPNPTAYWVRLTLTNQAKPNTNWLLVYNEYRINHIAAYIPDPDSGEVHQLHTGNMFPFSSRDFDYHYFVFRLDLPQDIPQTIFLYLSDLGGVSLEPLSIKSLNHFSQHALTEQFWNGAYYFSILSLAVFTIFFIFSLNDRSLYSFVLVLLAVTLTSLSTDGLGHQFIWLNSPFWAQNSTSTSIALYVIALLYYTLVVLKTNTHFPRLTAAAYAIMAGLVGLQILRIIPSLSTNLPNQIFIILLVLAFLTPIFLAIRSLKVQKQQAQFFLLAFSIYLIMIVFTIMDTVTGEQIFNSANNTRVAFIWILFVFSTETHIRINQIRKENRSAHEHLLREQEEALKLQKQLTEVMRKSRDDLIEAYDTTLEGWVQLLELRDKETEDHSRNVVELTLRFARLAGVPEEEMEHLRRGALLHDIGKIAIPDSILQKPGPLSEEEWTLMRQHPLFALKFLNNIPYLEKAMEIPAYHHEKWDGTGYPHKLKGKEIPLSARIFAIVDHWDALLSDRPYRKAWSREKTVNYLAENKGIYFDPDLIPVFLEKIIISD